MAGIDLSVSGLASGFDWKSMVEQLTAVERQPQVKVRSEQADLTKRRDALGQLTTRLSDLKKKAEVLQQPSLFASRTASSSDEKIVSATAAGDAVTGGFTLAVTTLATAASWRSNNTGFFTKVHDTDITRNSVGSPTLASINWGPTLTAGTVNLSVKNMASGSVATESITVSSGDTMADLFRAIHAATGIEATYSATTDKVTFTPPAGSSLILGAPNDTSNLLGCLKLFTPATPGIATESTSGIGSLRLATSLAGQPLSNPVSPASGAFTINGTQVEYSSTQTLSSLLAKINASNSGVIATYDESANKIVLRNKEPGNRGIKVADSTGNLMSALGILSGTLTEGTDLEFSINGGATQRSRSNTISETDSGLTGVTFTAKQIGSAKVATEVDTAAMSKAITDFMTAANSVQTLISSLTVSSRDAAGKVTSGVLAYDQTVFQLGSALRSLMMPLTSGPSSVIRSLEDLGFATSGYSNEITVSSAQKLKEALTLNLSEVKLYLSSASTGLASKVVNFAGPMVDEISGSIPSRQKALTEQSKRLDDQLGAMERRVQSNRERLMASFRAMEAAQSKSNQHLQFLAQKFANR